MLRSRKRLGIFDALPSYIGGKRRLAGRIFGEINRVIPRACWPRLVFLDAFMGGGSIALYAKAQAFGKVIGTDLALRSVTVGQALIANNRVKLTKQDVIRVLAPHDRPPGPVESEMVPKIFTQSQARAIDNALAIASRTEDVAKAALIKLLAIRLAMLAHAYSQIRPGTIHRLDTQEYESITPSATYHYIDGLRLATVERLWALAQMINGGIFEGNGEVHQTDVVETLPTIKADVMYADPPYANVCSYEKEYRVLDYILEGITRPTSPFTAKSGADQIDRLLERAVHIPVWVLSFGNAAVGLEELEAKMVRFGRRTKAIALKYQHLPAVATDEKKRENREFIVVGVDPTSDLQRQVTLRSDRPEVVSSAVVEQDTSTTSAQRPPPSPFAGDAGKQGNANLAQEGLPPLGAESLAVGDRGVDHPHAVLLEGAIDGHSEVGLAGHDGPASLVTGAYVKETHE